MMTMIGSEKMKLSKREMDMTEGPIFKKIISFSFPLVITGLLQCFYNAADLIVVGHYEGHTALAAVGGTGSLNSLFVNVFMGLSVGAGVCAAQYIGAKEHDKVRKIVHTSVLTALIIGVIVGVVGFIFAPQMLHMMGTPDNVIDGSVLYIRIIFLGLPALLLYNYLAAVLRSSGDTKHPLIFLTISGITNVILNIIMVAFFKMGVAGVAIATVAAQVLSAILIVIYMVKRDDYLRIRLKELRISGKYLSRMLSIGLPSGLQGAVFSISNVLIQSSINTFGDIAMAGNSATLNIEGFICVATNAIHQAAVTFVGQNIGAKKYKRIGKVVLDCVILSVAMAVILSGAVYLFRYPLLGLYSNGDNAVIEAGIVRMTIMLSTYFLLAFQDVICGALRGMGQSLATMLISLIGICGVRILWINTVFKVFSSIESIYISYPISWFISGIGNLCLFILIYKKLLKTGEIQIIKLQNKKKLR